MKKMNYLRRWQTAAALSALLALIIACAPAPTATPPPPTLAPAPTVAVAAPKPPEATKAPEPKRGGSLIIRQWTADPPDLDPFLNVTFRAQQFATFIYSRLLKFDSGPGIDPNASLVVGDLAEKWDASADGMTYTFSLRQNAKFHNKAPVNGRAVTADDVVYSYDRFTKVSPNKTAFSMVKEVKAKDANTVVFTLTQAFVPFDVLIASPLLFIMPKEVIERDGDARKNPLGSGPFMFGKHEKGVQVVFTRNPDYYITGKPYVDEVVSLIIPEDATAVAGLRAKSIDNNALSAADNKSLRVSNPELSYTGYPNTTFFFFFWKLDKPPFNDARVRQAVSMALDRDELINVIHEGQGTISSFVPPFHSSWHILPTSAEMGAGAKYFKRDIAGAKKLLTEAGYPTGLKVPLIATLNAYGNTFNQSVELVVKQLKDAGIEADFKAQDYTAYISSTFLGRYEAPNFVWGLQTPYQDPHDYLFNMYHPKGTRNHAGVDDPALTAMIEKQVVTQDKKERKKIIDDIQRYLGEKQYYVTGTVGVLNYATQPWVKNGYYTNDYGSIAMYATSAWLDNKPK